MFEPNRRYKVLPSLPPRVELDAKLVLQTCISTRAALAATKVAGDLIPNPTVSSPP